MEKIEDLFGQFNKLLEELHIPSTHHRFSQILHLLRGKDNQVSRIESLNIYKDLSDLRIIVEQASTLRGTFLTSSIEKMLGGNLYQKDDGKSEPRDYQAELVAASTFSKDGLFVKLGGRNPDILIYSPDILYGVEVKRVTSLDSDKAAERVKAAAKQLRDRFLQNSASDRTGIIYLSVENHLNNDIHVWSLANYEVARFKVVHELNNFMERHSGFSQNRDVFKDKRIAAIIVNYKQPYFDVSLQQYSIYNRYEIIPNRAYWQSIIYVFPQFLEDVINPMDRKTTNDRRRFLKANEHNMNSSIQSYIDASYVLSCSSLQTFKTLEDANDFISENINDASSGYECYKCEKWHIRGPDTIMFDAQSLGKFEVY